MFVDEKSNILVTIYYKTGKGKRGIKVETDLEKIPKEKRGEWKVVNFEMRPITWKMSNDLMRECRSKNMQTMMDEIDWITYKERKLQLTLVKWDATTEDGKPIAVGPEGIMKLHPLIAETLLTQYDKEAYLDDDERKN